MREIKENIHEKNPQLVKIRTWEDIQWKKKHIHKAIFHAHCDFLHTRG